MKKVKIKLKPVRLSIPKYGNGLMLCMEYLSKIKTVLPTKIEDTGAHIEITLPYTQHSIKHIANYINLNL